VRGKEKLTSKAEVRMNKQTKREWNWKPFQIPGTPCNLYGKYTQLKDLQNSLMDKYPQYEFRLVGIQPGLFQMEYSY
jgi:hypothetical protein